VLRLAASLGLSAYALRTFGVDVIRRDFVGSNVKCHLTGPSNFQQNASLLFWLPSTLAPYLDRSFNPAFGVIERATYASMCPPFHDKPLSGALARDVYDAFAEYRIAVSS
jgi:hypothetical protein